MIPQDIRETDSYTTPVLYLIEDTYCITKNRWAQPTLCVDEIIRLFPVFEGDLPSQIKIKITKDSTGDFEYNRDEELLYFREETEDAREFELYSWPIKKFEEIMEEEEYDFRFSVEIIIVKE